jgi:hypothetical protein
MTRMIALVLALAACVACLDIAEFGVGQIGPWLQAHMVKPWFVYACNLFTIAVAVSVALRHGKKTAQDDERLTPVVRRDPKTGLRQL